MANDAAKCVINKYLNLDQPGYALLVDAPWGVGKTHLIKELSDFEKRSDRLYITLYDVGTKEDFEWALVRAINPWSEKKIGKIGQRLKEFTSSLNVAGFSADLTKVNFTEMTLCDLPNTLVFDDIERCRLSHLELSGLINRFVEHQKKRVILIANSEKIEDENRFTKSREKLIGQTITLHPDLDAALNTFFHKIPKGIGKDTLQEKEKIVAKTFREAGHQNLRLLMRAMRDAANLLDAIPPDNLQYKHPLDRLISTFLALHMAYHGGSLCKEAMKKRGKYPNLHNSMDENDKSVFEKLHSVQLNHPECSITAHNKTILPVSLGYDLIVDGYASAQEIQQGLISTHQFSAPEEIPDWARLIHWPTETADELKILLNRVIRRLKDREITTPGEILIIYLIARMMAGRGAIAIGEERIAKCFQKYIKRLSENNLVPPHFPTSEQDRESYGYRDGENRFAYRGYSFDIDDIDRKVIESMKASQDEALLKEMPQYAHSLMEEFSENIDVFLSRFDPNAPHENFSNIPILQYFDLNDAVENFISLFDKDKSIAEYFVKIIGDRRKKTSGEFEAERKWIDNFIHLSICGGNNKSKIMGAQIYYFFKYFANYSR